MSTTYRVQCASDDLRTLTRHLTEIAREWGRHGDGRDTSWITQYELVVKSLSDPYADEFVVSALPD